MLNAVRHHGSAIQSGRRERMPVSLEARISAEGGTAEGRVKRERSKLQYNEFEGLEKGLVISEG